MIYLKGILSVGVPAVFELKLNIEAFALSVILY
jgi:hypothetical protein